MKRFLNIMVDLGTTSQEKLTNKYIAEVADMLTRAYTYEEQSELMIQLKHKLISHKEKQIIDTELLLQNMQKDLENFKNNC